MIEGIETVWVPSASKPAPVNLKNFAGADEGVSGFVKMYLGILEYQMESFRGVFDHIRDFPERPFLFHCLGGFVS